MTQKRPLVNASGSLAELASADTLAPATLATGTPDGTKFLRDDGTWQATSGSGFSQYQVEVRLMYAT